MGKLFNNLCKGPVVVIDDQIGHGDPIDKLIKEIESKKLPVLKYTTIERARKISKNLCSTNFIILDWDMIGVAVGPEYVTVGETAVGEDVIELIKEFKKTCLAPVFIISNLPPTDIRDKLSHSELKDDLDKSIFIESKANLIPKGALINKIENWVNSSPHIYLVKIWTNEWLSANISVFWDLYKSNSDWPAAYYESFVEDGEDAILALRETLLQLVSSEMDLGKIDKSFLERDTTGINVESLKDLQRRLVYTTNNIDRDIRPGDIFKVRENGEDVYYLNIRPECDTTKRARNPELYLLKGKKANPNSLQHHRKHGIIDRVNEINLLLLDGDQIVRFDKTELFILRYYQIKRKGEKICRVVPPFITRIRQSCYSFLGRYGVPRYPKKVVDSFYSS